MSENVFLEHSYWDTYFGADKEQHYKSKELVALEDKLITREFSFSSLSGSLLQFAKQGLSAAHGSPTNWPAGKSIGTQSLKDVILQARNQSEHWEEGSLTNKVQQCFNTLVSDFGPQFAQYNNKNLAFEIISLFDWKDFTKFKDDMLTMQ